jgi:hypothetical protein
MTDPSVDDIQTREGDELYLVRPNGEISAGVIFLHWFDESPTANRSQFLDEASELSRLGVMSALPKLMFPWESSPSDADNDFRRIGSENERLHRIHAFLAEGVSPANIAVVGHDFGAMHGMLLLRDIEAACAVWISPTARWSDWFLRFWSIDSDRFDYMRALAPVDPITTVGEAACPVLFQFGDNDFYIARMTASELVQATPEPRELLTYDAGHAMESEEIRMDRTAFLTRHLCRPSIA